MIRIVLAPECALPVRIRAIAALAAGPPQRQVDLAVEQIAETGKKRIGLLGFSFKAGTDDLRESPMVTLAEALLGKGYTLAIHDRNVSLARLVGANKQYIEHQIPHLSRHLCELDDLLTGSEVIVVGNALTVLCLFGLWAFADAPPLVAVALLVAAGLFGASFPMVVAHGRAFIPPHLMGRGVTLLNLFGIAPIGIAQIVTGRIHAATPPDPASAPYQAVFLFFAVTTAIGLIVYLLSQDRTD